MGLTSKKRLLSAATRIMDRMAKDSKPYETVVAGLVITVLPGVFSPRYFTDTAFFAKRLPSIVGRRSFFEVGVGTGAIALAVRRNGAWYVAGGDINPEAIVNTRINFSKYWYTVDVRLSSLFSAFSGEGRYDYVFWNHPYHNVSEVPQSMIHRSGMDYRYQDLADYFRLGKEKLTKDGALLLGTSNIARIREIHRLGEKYGYNRSVAARGTAPFARGSRQKIEMLIYKFTPR